MLLVICLIVSIIIFILLAIIILRNAYRSSKNKATFLTSLGGNILTIASILVATTSVLLTMGIKNKEVKENKILFNRDKIIKERVQWIAKVVHVPSERDLDLKILCYKTEQTLEPKEIEITVEIEYLNEFRMFVQNPPKRTFYDIRLKKLNDKYFIWELDNIQNIWSTFINSEGLVSDISVLEKPLALNIELKYNLDIVADAKVQVFPEIVTKEYKKNGINTEATFQHVLSTQF